MSAGMLGMARTTGTGRPRCFSMNAVLTEAATETSRCDGSITPRTWASTAGTVCGLTLRMTMSAARAASALDSVPWTPRSRRSRSTRCGWPAVTVMSGARSTPASSSPRMRVSPSLPAPSTASFLWSSIRFPAGRLRGRVGAPVVEAAAGLASMPAGQDHAPQERRRGEARLLELFEHDLRDGVGRVEAHVVAEEQRAHGIAAAELHGVVDVVAAREALLEDPHGVQH